jgi:hypothetical protein
MNMTLARRAVRLFPHTEYTDRNGVRHLRRSWMLAVAQLGDAWVLRQPIKRKLETESANGNANN